MALCASEKAAGADFLSEASQPKFWEVFADVLLRPGSRWFEMHSWGSTNPAGHGSHHSDPLLPVILLPVILPPVIPASDSLSVK